MKYAFDLFDRRACQAAAIDATSASVAWRDLCCAYRQLLQTKRQALWQLKVTAKHSSRQHWRSINELMGREHTPLSSAIDTDEIHWFSAEKVKTSWFPSKQIECDHRSVLTTLTSSTTI